LADLQSKCHVTATQSGPVSLFSRIRGKEGKSWVTIKIDRSTFLVSKKSFKRQ
jgi:hypothetical protein